MRYDATKVMYKPICIEGKEALFIDKRLYHNTVPEGLKIYEVREGGNDLVTIEESVYVNFYGTILTKESFYMPFGFLEVSAVDTGMLSDESEEVHLA